MVQGLPGRDFQGLYQEEGKTMRGRQHTILKALYGFIEDYPDTPNRWDCVNFCIGYFGNVNADHIEVIQYLLRQEEIVK